MKIALITDQHFGARNDSQILNNYFEKFYKEIFFPELEKRKIDYVVDLGDTFDRRKYINLNTLDSVRRYWFDELKPRKIHLDCIVGNHSTYYKNTNDVNSPDLLLREYDNIHVYKTAVEITIDKSLFLFVPWITDENREHTMSLMAKSKARFLFGHLEIKNFEIHRGHICEVGLEKDLFAKYDIACSGHFHKKSQQGNIHYLGAPYEMTWIDYNERKGFHIFDTDTGTLEFVENPHKLFHRVIYDDSQLKDKDILLLKKQTDLYQDRYIKLVVRKKTNPYLFDKYVTEMNEMKPANLVILEEKQFTIDGASDVDNIQVEDTPTILKKYVEALDDKTVPKNKLISLLTTLYQEANELET